MSARFVRILESPGFRRGEYVKKNNRIIAIGDIIDSSIRWSSRLTFNLKYYFDLDTPCIDKQLTDVIVSNIILQSMHK